MKEVNYNYLRLDNFTSLQPEFGGSKRKVNKNDNCNKENIGLSNGVTASSLSPSGIPSRTSLNPHNQSAILCSTPINELKKYGISSRQEFKTTFSSIDKQHQTNKKKSAPTTVSSYIPLNKQGDSSGGPKSCLTKQSRVQKVKKIFNANVAAFSSSCLFDEILDDDQCPRTEQTPLSGLLSNDSEFFLDDDCPIGNKKQKIDPNLNVESSSNFVESILDVGECNSFIIDNSSTSPLLSDGDDFFWDDDDVFVDNEIFVDNEESNLNEITRPCNADGYHEEIPYIDPENQNKKKRKRITMKEYYSYKLQVRRNEGMTVRLGGRLFQHGIMYVVEFQKRGLPHFPKKYCAQTTFDQAETEILEKVVRRNMNKRSQLEAFFLLNLTDPTARKYTFDEIPQHYVWNETDMIWHVRKRGRQIGRNLHGERSININDQQLQFYVLAEIDKLLKSIGKSLKQFNQLPQPPPCYLQAGTNNLVLEETSYNVTEMEEEFEKLFQNLNAEQLQVYHDVFQSVQTKVRGNGTVSPPNDCLQEYEEDEILIPSNFCDPEMKNSIKNMVQWTYPDFI
ncbi:hypothetical protein POM88_001992 [Heracleum sosnowskyi]|uniref:Uncharacterized protein n=1 Tax=Heracleum sosnowskyi TaxID=360622 RepID=A0AAD8JH77_9APIA|nr:hypothetical protein POM88_001992 [Heracleum sosnowskyi]